MQEHSVASLIDRVGKLERAARVFVVMAGAFQDKDADKVLFSSALGAIRVRDLQTMAAAVQRE